MNTFQILMLAATLYFAYHIYKHVQTLEDKKPDGGEIIDAIEVAPTIESIIKEADDAYLADDITRARDILSTAYENGTKNSESLNRFAYICAKLDDNDRAIELYNESLSLDDENDMTHNAIASIYKDSSRFSEAESHYKRALEIDDSYAVTYYNYANMLATMDLNDRAIEMYERAVELDSEFSEAKEALDELRERL